MTHSDSPAILTIEQGNYLMILAIVVFVAIIYMLPVGEKQKEGK